MASRTGLSEKDFYLHAFKHRSMLLHLADSMRLDELRPVVDTLLANQTMVLVSAGPRAGLGRLAHRKVDALRPDGLAPLSHDLLERGLALLAYGSSRSRVHSLGSALDVASGLGIGKLVVVDPRGGLRAGDGRRSFVTTAALVRLKDTGRWTAAELGHCRRALAGGLGSVNLTDASGLERELFSYEGAGTLITRGQYCRIDRLGIDDFDQALGLLARGEREGFLLKRTKDERAELLLSAYGAWFEGAGLAGLASLELERYRQEFDPHR